MSAPNTSPFDLTPPIRPTKDHFNGVAKEDDVEDPPDPRSQPNAAEWNTIEWLLLSIGRVMPVLVFSCSGGGFTKMGSAKTSLTISDLTYTVNGTGDVSITWPSGSFPSSLVEPMAVLNEGPGQIAVASIVNGVQVKTYDASGTPADRKFTVSVY